MSAPTLNGPTTTRLHHYAGRYCSELRPKKSKRSIPGKTAWQVVNNLYMRVRQQLPGAMKIAPGNACLVQFQRSCVRPAGLWLRASQHTAAQLAGLSRFGPRSGLGWLGG